MRQAGFDVMEINSPALVIENAQQFRPDLVLLDVMMPEMDGGDVAAAIAENPQLADVPIIFLTGIVSKKEVGSSGSMRGKHTFLAKPIKFVELLYCIDEQLRNAG